MKPHSQPESFPEEGRRDAEVVKIGDGPLVPVDSVIFKDVSVVLNAKLGRATLSVEELLALAPGSVVTLDVGVSDPIELRLNQSLIARGEIVAVDDKFGVRITEIAKA